MSDLAPLFTNVAEVLKNKTIEDLQEEINIYKEEINKLKKTRVTVTYGDYSREPMRRAEGPVAEGFLDEAKLVDVECPMWQNSVGVLETTTYNTFGFPKKFF